VSARQFRQPDFVQRVERALSDSGTDPARLRLELTESLLLDNINDCIATPPASPAPRAPLLAVSSS
jgi:EAL domain-containing protein (putative c-di-GMP-specific phosphodiesterase class I)